MPLTIYDSNGSIKATLGSAVLSPTAVTSRALVSWNDSTHLFDNPSTNLDANGKLQVSAYKLPAAVELTEASDAVTITQGYHTIGSETGTSDNLATINGGATTQFVTIQAKAAHTITVKNGTGNIFINVGTDFALSGDKTLTLFYDGTNWADIGVAGATTNGTFIVQTSNAGLPNAQALASLASGLMKSATTTGIVDTLAPGTAGNLVQSTGSDFVSHTPVASDYTFFREKLGAARTYYVRTDGSDSNDGLANTAGGAFLTIQKAINVASGLDNGGFDITIQVGNGTYTGANTLKGYVGSGSIIIVGDTTTPTNVKIQVTSADCFLAGAGTRNCNYSVRGFQLKTTTSGYGLHCSGGYLEYRSVDFDVSASSHIGAEAGGQILAAANYSITGAPASYHYFQTGAGSQITAPVQITFNTNPTAFAIFTYAVSLSLSDARSQTYVNKAYATGQRYQVDLNAVVWTGGGGATFLPGTVAGGTSFGGQYV